MGLLETYLGSHQIKKLIVERSEQLRMPLRYVCLEAGIDYQAFLKRYLHSRDGNPEITETQFEKILQCLGIETRYTIVVKTDFDAEAMKTKLRKKYESHKTD